MIDNLIWLVYLGGVVGGLGTVVNIAALALSICLLFAAFIGFAEDFFDDAVTYTDKDKAFFEWGERARRFVKFYKRGAWAVLVAWISVIFVPSKDVVYALAASEVAKHPRAEQTANKALDALDAWLDKQIADTKE